MKKSFIVLIVAMLIFTTLLPSTGFAYGAADANITLKLLRLGDILRAEPIFTPIIDAFEKENPNITVKFEAMGWGEATTKLRLQGAQGALPDVCFINIANGWDLAAEGYLMDLSSKVSGDAVLSKEIPKSVIDTVSSSDGSMYWVPAATGAFGLWYNKELFTQAGLDPDKPPKTVEELISFSKQITEKTGVPGLGFGVAAMEDFGHVVMSFYSSYTGVDVWDDEKRAFTFEENEEYKALFAQALTEIYKIVNEYGITQPNPVEINPYGLRPLFRDGQVAMCLDGVWAVKDLLTELDKGKDSKFASALFPAGPAGSNPILGCDGWAIPAEAKNPEEAWELLKFIMSSDNQTRHSTMWGLMPLLASEASKEAFSAPYWAAMIEQQASVSGRPKDKQVNMIEMAIAQFAQAAAVGQYTPEQAIDMLIEEVHTNLQD